MADAQINSANGNRRRPWELLATGHLKSINCLEVGKDGHHLEYDIYQIESFYWDGYC